LLCKSRSFIKANHTELKFFILYIDRFCVLYLCESTRGLCRGAFGLSSSLLLSVESPMQGAEILPRDIP
jgi:hypothetical protein